MLLALVGFSYWLFFARVETVTLGAGVMAADPPQQENVNTAASFNFMDYQISPLASFSLQAKVLSKKRYYWGRAADLIPVDLALGWGPMSDESLLKTVTISQSNRWYYIRSQPSTPLSIEQLLLHSANMHMIPADRSVAARLKKVKPGEIIQLRGQLVAITAADGWQQQSSLRRDDSGAGACELVFVQDFYVVP